MSEVRSADAMWSAYCAATGTAPDTSHDDVVFGDSNAMADELAELIASGRKRATACLIADCLESDGTTSPGQIGDLWVVTDSSDRARCVARTTEIRIDRFDSVDDRFAFDEGEGDRTLAFWTEAHDQYFRRRCEDLGIAWSEDIAVVFERFEVVWPHDHDE